ncbi:MAG TPA: 3-isopropylmalate dehydratase small subunit [Chloroflexota bacterium]|jgi:3-isopropylmalate/(R)-2-methylmalate dehydratase small subunit|nr:3-isopropylmalate dehydratase small subunit [Chloroflexota bacterium]
MYYEGTAHRYGDDIDTDVILPGPYMNLANPEDLARHALEGLDPGFVARVRRGDVLVVGRNFGCGSSREHAPIALKAAGISCLVAKSFARIFFRNAINVGLPVVIAPDAVEYIADGAWIGVDTGAGEIRCGAQVFTAQPFPPFIRGLMDAGGLDAFVRERLAARHAS